ncbi:hypothetical protein L7F22_005878 [Adiantum nelumboides]|nr:hypothetical protein [Adiantum nelumboides]
MLTRIIYHAIGTYEMLLPGSSQNEWLREREEEEEEAVPQSTRMATTDRVGGRKLETVPKDTQTLREEQEAEEQEAEARLAAQRKGKRKMEEERPTILQKRAKMERMLARFVVQRSMRGDFGEKWKSSSASSKLRTKNPRIEAYEEAWFNHYIQANEEDEPQVQLFEEDFQILKD